MNTIMDSIVKRFTVYGLVTVSLLLNLVMQPFVASPANAQTTLPVLWTAGGLSAGNESAGQSSRMASDTAGNVAIVSGPALARGLGITSYTAGGTLRWQRTVNPSSGTFRADWVVATPNGDFAAVGTNIDALGNPFGITMVRYASDGTLLWRVDLARNRPSVARLIADSAGNTYLAFNSIGDGQDIQLHKYNPSGILIWSQVVSTGSFANNIATSLALSQDESDVVVTGDTIGGTEWITAVYNATTGTPKWQVVAPEGSALRDVVVDATRVYVTGVGNVGTNSFLTVVAYDRATGARLWRTDANPSTAIPAYGLRIALAPDGSLVVAGQAASGYFDWWIVALENSGAVRWQVRRDRALTGDEIPASVFVLADGTTVVSGVGGPTLRDVLGNQYLQGVTAGYSPNGTLLWEGFSRLPSVWATALPNGDVCATGGYDALITCWKVSGVVSNQPPTPVLTATPLTGAAPLLVTFDGTGSTDPDGTIVSYFWNFGDGSNSTAANPTHTYTTAGTYTATLTVTDNENASSSTSATISVYPASNTVLRCTAINLIASLQRGKVAVSGQVIVRDATNTAVSGARVNVTWFKPDGTSITQVAKTSSNGKATFNTSGVHGTYTLTVTAITKSGYTFDAANSVLSKSITK